MKTRFGVLILPVLFLSVAVVFPQESLIRIQPPGPPQPPSPAEVEIYKQAHSLIDWTAGEVRSSSLLHGVRAAASQDQISLILGGAGRAVTQLFTNFPQVSCDEEVCSDAYGLDPRKTYERVHYPTVDRKFRYIVIPSTGNGQTELEEYRTDPKGDRLDSSRPGGFYMLTSDFASNALYLGPSDQQITRFRYFGTQAIRNHECYVLGFAQDPARVSRVGEAFIESKRFAILVQGLAWIDSDTFQIQRMKTWLLAPRTDVGLNSETSTVDYCPVQYPVQTGEEEKALWLPRDVTVEIAYHDLLFRNNHHYSNFKFFRVEVTTKTGQ